MFLFTGVKFIPETIYNIDIETNPLDETIKICIDELFKSEIAVLGFNKKEMFEMLLLTLKEYNQIDGVAMSSSLGLTLANIFRCYHESNWQKDYLKDFKPAYYKRYVNDIFILFNQPEHAQFFLEFVKKNIRT